MSEPVPAPSDPGFPPDEPRLASPAEDALLGGPAEPSDDTPTIISKNPPRPPAPAEDLFASGFRGRRLAHFELIEPIGVGGMAAVLRARDTQLDRCVALKILPPDMAQDAENVRRFHQEARSAAKLDHENIARVFFCGEDQRLHFIAFEFVEGDNLRTILERRGRLPVGEALHYMLQVAAGLAHAARRGVVHRDIKPSNIIITPNGRAKLVDMGLARSLAPHSEHDLTQSGVTLGTFDYISPEQALEPRDADVRSDIYSLGCTFYHMLTGHPPVPEGTALKKLHHHQHVKPPDPRQFVPDLPNEVAYILDRMMAKQVKDRYQTPEQLVHHLLLAARKLGAVGEVPEGVLSVEAALPNPPRSRPLLLAVLAAAAVVALVFFLDQPPGPQPRTPDPSPGANSAGPKDNPRQVETNPFPRAEGVKPPLTETIVPPGKPKVAVFNSDRPTEAGLVAFLQENEECEELDINLSGDLDFTPRFHDREQGPIQGLILRNKKVRIRSRGDRPATVRLSYDSRPQDDDKGTRAVFTILGKESQVEGIRFVVDARESQTALAGLVFRGGGQHRVSRCTFLQARPSLNEKKPLASVLVEAPEGGKLALLLEACAFLGFRDLGERPASAGGADEWLLGKAAEGGQDAVLRRGPAQVQAVNCAFGPHAAAFRLEGPGPAGGDPNLEVSHCSVLATRPSAVFDFAADADARIKVEGSLIARLENAPFLAARGDARGAVLVRQPTGQGPLVTYQGQGNRYHNLDGYWSILDGTGEAGWEEFGKRLAAMDRMDAESSVLRVSPWKDPMVLEQWKDKPLEQFDGKAIAAVFQPDPSRAELAFGDSLAGVKGLAGVEYRLNPPDAVKPSAVRRTLYVEEGKLPDPENRVYPTLGHVLPLLRPGDRVLLRHNGEVKMGPVELNTQERSDVTIAPDEGFHPILTLTDKENVDVDTALFRVHDGKLTLENLEFRVRARKGFTALGVVSLVGDGQCLLKHCAVTLDRGDQSERLPAVAVLPDPGKVMKMVDMTPPQPREQVPRLVVENCFVRGEGDLVWVRACRAAKCEVSGSLVALTGSLLNVEAAREAPPAPPTLAVTLLRTTTYLQGPLLRVRTGKESKGLAMLQCQPDECLFVPAAAGERVLVRLEGPEGEDKALQGKVQWERGRNAYGTFNMMLDYQAPGDSAMPMTMAGGVDSWKKWSNDSMSSYGVRLPTLPPYDLSLIQVLPAQFSQFKPADDTSPTCGADLKAVATPREEPRPPAATP
jgi:serine/threonine protein kinase